MLMLRTPRSAQVVLSAFPGSAKSKVTRTPSEVAIIVDRNDQIASHRAGYAGSGF